MGTNAKEGLAQLAGTAWVGSGELWLDPDGNEAHRYECSLTVDATKVSYTWSHEGKPNQGTITLRDPGAVWSDTWHQPQAMSCSAVPDSWGLLDLRYSYPVPGGPDWGWRILLSRRPRGELVLQMTNVTPWGEEGRAVRMVFKQTS